MKVYFSASRTNMDKYSSIYDEVKGVIKESGFEVEDNGRFSKEMKQYSEMTTRDKNSLYRSVVRCIESSDMCVFEASFPSTLHIGHEITLAVSRGKPTVVLFEKNKEPLMFHGLPSAIIIWVEYERSDLEKKLLEALVEARKKVDVRLNMFIPGSQMAYLDQVTKKMRVTKSEYVRGLIEKAVGGKR